MLNAYIDDSGNAKDPQETAFTLTGYVFTAHNAMLFSDSWQEVLRRCKVPYIHTREAIRLDGVYAGLSGDQMNTCLVECAKVIQAHAEFELSCVIETGAWERAQPLIRKNELHEFTLYSNPYFLQYATLIQHLHHHKFTSGYSDDVTFLFDKHSVNMNEVAELYHKIRGSAPDMFERIGISIDPPNFYDDQKIVPLQAADMAAYTVRRLYDKTATKVGPFENVLREIKPVRIYYDDKALNSMLGAVLSVANGVQPGHPLLGAEISSWLAGKEAREQQGEG